MLERKCGLTSLSCMKQHGLILLIMTNEYQTSIIFILWSWEKISAHEDAWEVGWSKSL